MRALLLAVLAGCAGADAMTTQGPVPAGAPLEETGLAGLHPGETMAFEVRLAGALVGEAQLAVGEVGQVDGKDVIVVRSRAATAGAAAVLRDISDEAMTTIDVATGRPLSLESAYVDGKRGMTASAKFDGGKASVTYQRTSDPAPKKLELNFGDITLLDPHTAMAHIRAWKGGKGATKTVFVIGGRRLWKIDLAYTGEETIGTALGNRRAIVLTGQAYRSRANRSLETAKASRSFTVWLSDDADRVPLKVAAKTERFDVTLELTDYARP